MKNIALILASGIGTRCKLGYPKQFAEINGKTILEYTVEKFQNCSLIDYIYIVTNSEYIPQTENRLKSYSKVKKIVAGGETRKESSYNGVFSIEEDECNLLIHDGARPLVTEDIIKNCIKSLSENDAVCTTINSTDTIFVTDDEGYITTIPVRATLKRAQTPQCFKLSLIKKAHTLAKEDKNCNVTDDCGLIYKYKLSKIKTIKGDDLNIKITTPQDIEILKNHL